MFWVLVLYIDVCVCVSGSTLIFGILRYFLGRKCFKMKWMLLLIIINNNVVIIKVPLFINFLLIKH